MITNIIHQDTNKWFAPGGEQIGFETKVNLYRRSKMRIAFDVKGTLEGNSGELIRELFKKLREMGHTCVIWSNLYSYAVDCNNKYNLQAKVEQKRSKSELAEWGKEVYDWAIEDDTSQKWLGAKNFLWVRDIESVDQCLTKMGLK